MAKQPRVWTGTQWDTLAVTLPDLSNYSTTTQMNTAIGANAGLNLLSTQTVSAVSSVSFTNFLSSTYTHYRLIMNLFGTDALLYMRARINTTDQTAASYSYAQSILSVSSSSFTRVATNQTQLVLGNNYPLNGNSDNLISIDMFNSSNNRLIYTGTFFDGYYIGSGHQGGYSGKLASPATGFTLFPSTGTMTGTIALYGYKKAL